MARRREKIQEFQELLSKEEIDLQLLQQISFNGCPEKEGIRATCWKLLLGYLPLKRKYWTEELQKQRSSYHRLMNEIISNPYDDDNGSNHEQVDHPLNPNPDSQWHKYFEDNEILVQIDHDTRRLYPELSFFQLATSYPRKAFNAGAVLGIEALKERVDRSSLPSQKVDTSRMGVKNVRQTTNEPFSPLKEGEEAHWEVVERILFIYAKINKGIGYVQGMNEIIGPIYYVFAKHPDPSWKEHAEADTFFCFSNIMVEIGDHFIKKMDRSRAGIGGSMHRFMSLLKSRDPDLHKDLEEKEIDPAFFGFRWITLLLSQEFLLPDVIRLWDSLFSDSKRFNFLLCVRTDILSSDFSNTIKLLQNYPINDIQRILQKAQDIQRFYALPK